MNTIQVNLGDRSYPIYMGEGNLNNPELLTQHIKSKQVVI
jgi:3-dehydroquinate synthase